ncbi:hypothetical protein CJF42_19210 [Pseudoalteromonas sp. NBT06-2]|uniref:CsiV family protein n=1 Tax=Pseudoalteromonas sp. NBT06-2 TaxID=2025950 RepID=UPI000BA74DBD|nr:CsiV family protein [Pseudoalteromonas sp. NBT06-2]PAJ72813.1 hypothetical protein CJF42_19210 [Pseudoalteromonas sp. NBT06-2]
MKLRSLIGLSLLLLSTASISGNGRWYEVEIVLFEHPDNEKVKEDFSFDLSPIKTNKSVDMLSEHLQLMGQNKCLSHKPQTNILNKTLNTLNSPVCVDSINYIALMDKTPLTLDAPLREGMETPYIIAAEELEFQTTISRLKREGMIPILHTGWRQPGLTERNAPNYRLFGGKNFSKQYNYFGNLKQIDNTYLDISDDSDDINSLLKTIINSDTSIKKPVKFNNINEYPDKTWQLDGLLKIFLRGKYLNIKAEFNLRAEDRTDEKLKSFHFNQFRRVISNEIHYFDHPKLGILIQIRRYMH